jgi:hypothetical protein
MAGDPRPIGVFDSGMGGLTVLRALAARLLDEHFVYLGDTARLPYGTKSPDTVRAYALQATHLLLGEDVKMVVIACNTASSVALEALQEALAPVPVIGVIEPGARAGVAATRNKRIGVLATESTVKGGAYARAIHRLMADAEITQLACQVFVALAEEGWADTRATAAAVEDYLEPLYAGVGLHAFPGPRGGHPAPCRRRDYARGFGGDDGSRGRRNAGKLDPAGALRLPAHRALLRHGFAGALRTDRCDFLRTRHRRGRCGACRSEDGLGSMAAG